MRWMLAAAAMIGLVGCGGKGDSGCDDGSAVKVSLMDSVSGNPIMGSIEWTDSNGDSGSMDCAGACEFSPAEGTVSVTATPTEAQYGESQTEGVLFARSAECDNAVFALLNFEF